jgi:hypothetical protein
LDINTEEKLLRPELLKVLCILSFIGGGYSLLSNGFMFLLFDEWAKAYDEGLFDVFDGQFEMTAIQVFLNVDKQFYLFQTLLYSLSVYGVYLMWKLKKIGFHTYSIAQILVLIVQKIFIPSLPFPVIPLLLTLTFIILYFKNLPKMH